MLSLVGSFIFITFDSVELFELIALNFSSLSLIGFLLIWAYFLIIAITLALVIASLSYYLMKKLLVVPPFEKLNMKNSSFENKKANVTETSGGSGKDQPPGCQNPANCRRIKHVPITSSVNDPTGVKAATAELAELNRRIERKKFQKKQELDAESHQKPCRCDLD